MDVLAALAVLASLAPAQTPAAPAPQDAVLELTAVGDVRLDGHVAGLARRRGDAAPSKLVKDLLRGDIEFANLETPVTAREERTGKDWTFKAAPEDLRILKAAGLTVLNIANNHVWDYGRDGFLDTLQALEKGGWAYVGGGRDRAEAEKARLFRIAGLTVGIVGVTSTYPADAWAGEGKPGVAFSGRLKEILSRARGECDVLVVSFHGGEELAPEPNKVQTQVAHAAIDAGADLFLGHHPHVLQAVEIYRGKPILYSLGNFLFVSPAPAARPSVIARAALGKGGVRRLTLTPIDVNGGMPKAASPETAATARAALDRLGALEARPDLVTFAGPAAPRP